MQRYRQAKVGKKVAERSNEKAQSVTSFVAPPVSMDITK